MPSPQPHTADFGRPRHLAGAVAAALAVIFLAASLLLAGRAAADEPESTDPCPSWETQYEQLTSPGPEHHVVTARHRGFFDKYTPENSLRAFAKSLAACHPAIETDVRLTADGVPVSPHDVRVGKMFEPTYDPETDTGPNDPIAELTLEEISAKQMVARDRTVTHYTIPTIEQILDLIVERKGQALLHLEIKDPAAMGPTAQVISRHAQAHPEEHLDKRVIMKFPMHFAPTPEHWSQLLADAGVTEPLMAYPYVTPAAAAAIDDGEVVPDVEGLELSTNAARAVAQWAAAPSTVAPGIEVVIKDTSEFYETDRITDSTFGPYNAPTSLALDNAQEGTMTEFVAIVHHFSKRLGAFVPVPDFMLFYEGPEGGFTVPNSFGPEPVVATAAFFNAQSSCCYDLSERRQRTKYAAEEHEWRMNLDFHRHMGVTLITADDTDTVELHAQDHGQLDHVARPSPTQPPAGMRSALFTEYQGHAVPDTATVKIKGWGGASASAWGGQVCLWSDPEAPVWTAACNIDAPDYTTDLEIHAPDDGTMRIRDPRTGQCLVSNPEEDDRVPWSDDCTSARAKWVRTAEHRFLDAHGRALTFAWDDRYYYGHPYAYNYLVEGEQSSWSVWDLVPSAGHADDAENASENTDLEAPLPPVSGARPGGEASWPE